MNDPISLGIQLCKKFCRLVHAWSSIDDSNFNGTNPGQNSA